MKKFAIIYAASFLLSLVTSLGQGLFYWPQASPADGGTVNSSIASRGEDAIVEHYQAVPAPGYVFDSWSLYPRGEHGESLYVHTYDPRLSYTEEIKPITAHFVKEDTVAEPVGKDLEIRLKEGNQMELTVPTERGIAYLIYRSSNLQDWTDLAVFEGNGQDYVRTFSVPKERNGFFRLFKSGVVVNPESAVTGELRVTGFPEFLGGSVWIRLWEYDPRIADKGADLFAEQTIHGIGVGPGLKLVKFELGDRAKANPALNYYITASLYKDGKVGDLESRIYFLDGFNRVDIPSAFSGHLKKL